MKTSLRDIPLGAFFLDKYDRLCYKDNPTIGTDTNYCIVYQEFFSLNRGYSCESNLKVCKLIDERFLNQLTLF